MKIDQSKIQFSLGKNKSKNYYKLTFVIKDEYSKEFKEKFKNQIEASIFTGEEGQTFTDEIGYNLFLGIGEIDKISLEKLSSYFLGIGEKIYKWKGVGLEIFVPKYLLNKFDHENLSYQICNSISLGCYSIKSLSTKDKEKKEETRSVSFDLEEKSKNFEKGIEKSKKITPFINSARWIAHLPANHFTPEEFVERSREIAKENKLKITIFKEPDLEREKMGGILAVGHGSDKESKMIILEYKPVNAKKKLAIIGKGLTFDAGGISLKPASDMHEMKYDMCGAAATIHAIGAIASLELPIHVIAAIGVAENMPDGSAIKPGDVYTAYNGLTVEVQNTDAEGRLVLADVISYICKKFEPEYMVDMATLTGAIVISLGHESAGLMGNSKELNDLIQKASEESLEKTWILPFWEEYAEGLKSDIADVRNIAGREGGSISAGKFLEKFIIGNVKWAHLDIAGTAWRKKGAGNQPGGGPTGYGVRLMVELANEIIKKK